MSDPNTAMLLAFLLLFPLIVWGLSIASGWHLLAEHFKTSQQRPHNTLKWKSGTFANRTDYGGLLNVAATEKGLYVATNVLLRFAHPPIFIPWGSIVSAEIAKQSRVWLTIKLDQSERKMLKVRLYGKGVSDQLRPFLELIEQL